MFASNLFTLESNKSPSDYMINVGLISADFEIETKYFDIVDESRVFLKNLMPLKAVRFREEPVASQFLIQLK